MTKSPDGFHILYTLRQSLDDATQLHATMGRDKRDDQATYEYISNRTEWNKVQTIIKMRTFTIGRAVQYQKIVMTT